MDEAGEQNPTNDSIYIPKYVAKSSLYSMYQFDWISRKLNASELPSTSSFYNIFDSQFSHVKFLKQTILGRCDFCMSIPTQKSKITSEVDKNAFLEACAQHRELYTRERTAYSNRTFTSKTHPEQMLHLAFDCPDGYDVPHIIPVTKETSNLPKVSISAVGTINHSAQIRDYMFFLDEYKKDSNLMLTCFYLHILQHFSTTGNHPPILWLQADNCFKENKNRWMMGFCYWLVHIGWFREIMISMLPPGHTHIDIDQMFSTLSMFLDRHSVEFIADILQAVNSAYKKENTKPKAAFLPVVFNFVGFLALFVHDLSGLNSAHVYLFHKLANGKVGMKVKQWHSTNSEWRGSVASPDEWITLMHQFPTGFPETIAPHPVEDMLDIETVRKYNLWMSDKGLLSWQSYLQELSLDIHHMYPIPEDYDQYHHVCIINASFVFLCLTICTAHYITAGY